MKVETLRNLIRGLKPNREVSISETGELIILPLNLGAETRGAKPKISLMGAVKCRREGMTLEKIGEKYGVTKQAVHDMFKRWGLNENE